MNFLNHFYKNKKAGVGYPAPANKKLEKENV